jgi:hypothetical protein
VGESAYLTTLMALQVIGYDLNRAERSNNNCFLVLRRMKVYRRLRIVSEKP